MNSAAKTMNEHQLLEGVIRPLDETRIPHSYYEINFHLDELSKLSTEELDNVLEDFTEKKRKEIQESLVQYMLNK